MKIKTMKKIFRMTQDQLMNYCETRLRAEGYKNIIKKKGSYLVATGERPIGLVAHLDTVHRQLPSIINFDADAMTMTSPMGLGADDRAGVIAIIELLHLKPTVILCCDEEIGAIGASDLVKDFPSPITELKYLIEIDRSGVLESVFYDCDNEDFEKYVNSFGFTSHFGSFSDISIIAPAWKIAAVNLSAGYKAQHTTREILSLPALMLTQIKVADMLKDTDETKFEYIEAEYISKYKGYYNHGGWIYSYDKSPKRGYDEYGSLREPYDDEIICDYCGTIETKAMAKDGVCSWCARVMVSCDGCGELCYKSELDGGFCKTCRDEIYTGDKKKDDNKLCAEDFKRCENCGASIFYDEHTCPFCKCSLICIDCGTPQHEAHRFCQECGGNLTIVNREVV